MKSIQSYRRIIAGGLSLFASVGILALLQSCVNPTSEQNSNNSQSSAVACVSSTHVPEGTFSAVFQVGTITNNGAIISGGSVSMLANSINLGSASVIRTSSGTVRLSADKIAINTTGSASKINANAAIIDKLTPGAITVANTKSSTGTDLQLSATELYKISSKSLFLSTSKVSAIVVNNINILADITRNGSITLLANNNIFVKQSKNILADLVYVTAGNALILDKYARIKTNKDSLIATGANSVQLGYASILNGQGDVHVSCTIGDIHVSEKAQLFSAKGTITMIAKKQAAVEKRALLKAFRDIAIRGDNEVIIGGKSCNTNASSCNTPSGPTLCAGNNIVLTSKRIKIFAGAVLKAGGKIIKNWL